MLDLAQIARLQTYTKCPRSLVLAECSPPRRKSGSGPVLRNRCVLWMGRGTREGVSQPPDPSFVGPLFGDPPQLLQPLWNHCWVAVRFGHLGEERRQPVTRQIVCFVVVYPSYVVGYQGEAVLSLCEVDAPQNVRQVPVFGAASSNDFHHREVIAVPTDDSSSPTLPPNKTAPHYGNHLFHRDRPTSRLFRPRELEPTTAPISSTTPTTRRVAPRLVIRVFFLTIPQHRDAIPLRQKCIPPSDVRSTLSVKPDAPVQAPGPR